MVGFGTQSGSSSPTAVNNWNPQQQALFNTLAQQLQAGASGPVPVYPNQMYVGTQPQEESYFNMVNDTSGARMNALRQIGSGQLTEEQRASYSPEVTQNYYNESIRNPALREFNEVTQPAIAEQYAGPGYWGSARADATARASGDLATNLAAARAKLAYDDQTAMRAAQDAALNRQTTAPGAYATEAAIQGTAGQYARTIEQERMLSDYQRWLSGEAVGGVTPSQYSPYLQLMFQALGLSPFTIATEGSESGFNFGMTMPSGGG